MEMAVSGEMGLSPGFAPGGRVGLRGCFRYRTIRGLNALVNTAPLIFSYSGETSSKREEPARQISQNITDCSRVHPLAVSDGHSESEIRRLVLTGQLGSFH